MLATLGTPLHAQLGGRSSYEFLNIPTHARLVAMGGVNVSYADRDVNFFFNNPALVGDSLAGWASASYLFHVADIGQAVFAGSHSFEKLGTLSFGIQHIGYGEMDGFDATGSPTGTYRSGETALVIGKSHQISHFRMGVNVKTVFSNLAGFRSAAVMVDLGGVFIHPHQDLRIGLVFKNLGWVMSDYTETRSAKLPFDVQAGITYKPEYMPVRFSFTTFNLGRPGKLYDDPDEEDRAGTLDKVISHLNFGAEILLHRNVQFLAGYNHLRQKELRAASGGGGSGFTFGLAADIKSFQFSVSHSRYGVGNANYTFTLAANFEQMIFKKKTL